VALVIATHDAVLEQRADVRVRMADGRVAAAGA